MPDSDISVPPPTVPVDVGLSVPLATQPSVPTLSAAVGDLFAMVAAEIAGAQSAEAGDALRVRAALLAWDGLGDRTRALEVLADAEHPLASVLRLGLGQSPLDEPRGTGSAADHAVGAASLFARGAYSESAEIAERAGVVGALVRRIALGVLGSWSDLLRDAESEAGGDTLEEAAAIALDRLSDGDGAAALLRRLYDSRPHPYVIERLLDLRDSTGDSELEARAADILRAKLDCLEAGANPERIVTMFSLAGVLERGGNDGEAEGHINATLGATADHAAAFSLLAQHALVRLCSKRGDWQRTAEAYEALARESGSPTFAGAYLRRAAEIWDARVGAADRAEPLFARLNEADPGDTAMASALVRLMLRRSAPLEVSGVLARLGGSHEEGTQGGLLLAAWIEEIAGSPEAATHWRAWADAISASSTPSDEQTVASARAHALEGVARGLRQRGGRRELIDHYRLQAATLDADRSSVYLSVAGALALEEGLTDVAATLFDEAASRGPDDLLVHAGRVHLYERTDRHADLAAALKALTKLVESSTGQVSLHRRLAKVSVEHLNDVATAHDSFERLLEIEPENVTVIEAFVRLCAEGGKWARAIELIDRAVSFSEGDRAAELLRFAGELSEKHLADDDAALSYYERAHQRSPSFAPALVAIAALHRKFNRLEMQLTALRELVSLAPPRERRVELLLDYARTAEKISLDQEHNEDPRAFVTYGEVLALDPAQPAALQGVERLCRANGRWSELADTLARAPENLRNLRVRAESLEHLERWAELAKVRELELRLLEEPAEIAAAARALASLYETRLHNPEAAVRTWSRVVDMAPSEPEPLRALQRLHETAGRHPALAVAIERELELGEVIEIGRRIELWTKLGDLRRGSLSAQADAAQAFEEVLRLDPKRPEVLEQLIQIYKSLNRGEDLSRILDARAETANNPQQRANMMREKAELLEREDDVPGALTAYQKAFELDPESRACFTAYEKLCYRAEKWKQALELYQVAIDLVENNKSRAYRLADLYARRGQLQVQYLGAIGEATNSYKKVLELDPENDAAQTALERILSAQSDWTGLVSVYELRAALLKNDARRVEVLRRAARVASSKLRDNDEAARLYERLHVVDPTDSEASDTLERHYERSKEIDKLVTLLRTRLSFATGADETIALYSRIARLSEEGLRDADKTIEAYQKILEIAPSNREAIDALGRLYEGTERWAELVEVTRRQIRLVTDRAQKALLYFKCGSVMESKFAKEDDAIRYYDAAIKTSPSCLPAVHGLRDLHLRRQDWPRVIQTLELEAKLWTEDKERAGVFAHIGQIYGERLADPERAIQYYETALEVDRECLPANKALFELYTARGEYQQALTLASVLTQKVSREGDPVERSEFYRKRSIVAEHTGNLREAVDSLVVALEIRPENLEALDMLVGLCRTAPDAYDYANTFRELEKLHRKRDAVNALARVLVGQASLLELGYEIDAAEEGYLAALNLAPSDFTVLEPLVSLNERLRRFPAAEALIEAFLERVTDRFARTNARMRLATLYGDAMMDSEKAAETLKVLVAEDPADRDGCFAYAQELYLLGRYAEARKIIDTLIERSTAPEHTARPEELARFYDYLGRILEATGDQPGSGRAFRRAVDLDPTYPPACLGLARRAAATGDLVQGMRILADALDNAENAGNSDAALTLQRTRARFLVTWGELALAAEAYRSLLERAPRSVEDRIAYADLLGRNEQTISQAFGELEQVLALEPRHSQAYRQLSQLYMRVGQSSRAARVHSLMTLMGIIEPADRPPVAPPIPRRGVLSDELRAQYLGQGVRGAWSDALAVVRESLESTYPFTAPEDAVPLSQTEDPSLRAAVQDLERVFGVNADVFVAPSVPGGYVVNDFPSPVVYLDAGAGQTDRDRRVLLGAALETLRGGYALLTRIGSAARLEVANLVEQLRRPDTERTADAQGYVRALPRKAQKALEKLTATPKRPTLAPGAVPTDSPVDGLTSTQWLDELEHTIHRAALIASDDLGACARALTTAKLSGRVGATPTVSPPVLDEKAVLGDSVLALDRGPDVTQLTSFYLSETYHTLRQTIGESA